MSLSLQYRRSAPRFLAARAITGTRVGGRWSGTLAGNIAPLRLVDRPEPELPGQGWTRVAPVLSGICGSDLSLLTGRSSPYLGPLTSMPFVPGHEVVGTTLDELPGLPRASRVVIDPVLACAARGMVRCASCVEGRTSRCDQVATGHLAAGLQTGFCTDTGGGWGRRLVAHHSQLHRVPEELTDERAVLVEPLACAVHSVRRIDVPRGASVLIVGAGTVGLFTLLALRRLTAAGEVHVVAKHRHQADRARSLGATHVVEPARAARALRRSTGALLLEPDLGEQFLLGGVDVAIECTGGTAGLDTALRSVRAGGTVLLSGMPSGPVDLTPLWFRELHLVGAYASGSAPQHQNTEHQQDDFAEAIALAGSAPLDGYVDTTYPLERWRDALDHAASAGRMGTIKVAFAPASG